MADALLPEALHGWYMVTLCLAIFVAIWIAGIVKGIVGLGTTTVPVGLLTALVDLQTAMARSHHTNFNSCPRQCGHVKRNC